MVTIEQQLEHVMPTAISGVVAQMIGMTATVADFPAPVGAMVRIEREQGGPLDAQVIGFRDHQTLIYPFSRLEGVRRGNRVRLIRTARWLRVGDGLLGRVLNSEGRAVDGKPQPITTERVRFDREPPHPCNRPPIKKPLGTGIRSIDAMLSCGRGQRMGVFAGSGVGKSVTMGMMARYTAADVIVIGLIGERGREVNEFIERDLGPEGLKKSVVVVATSDEPALVRVNAASTATAIAEYYRDRGKNVLLLIDSLTRFALAQREIGLAAGEPPTTRGFPPSVFALLPKLVERAGCDQNGTITAFYTVLVEGDDPNEPISDTVRGLLDGHIWLSRRIASRGHYPAVDILESLSRLMPVITDEEHRQSAMLLREILSAQRDQQDMISIGAYRKGSNPAVDLAIELEGPIRQFLTQKVEEPSSFEDAKKLLLQIGQTAQGKLRRGK